MNRRDVFLAAVCIFVAGCARASVIAAPPQSSPALSTAVGSLNPDVIQSGQTGKWRFFAYPTPYGTQQEGIVVGPDKNIWITDYQSALIRATMTAKMKAFNLPPVTVEGIQVTLHPTALAVGPDGKFYMTTESSVNNDGIIAVATTSGSVTGYAVPNEPGDSGAIVLGPDGNMWFAENSHIAKITTSGVVTQYAYSKPNAGYANGVTVGPDGFIWFTEQYNGKIGKIQPGSSTITEYTIADSSSGPCRLNGIVNGGDGKLYAVGGNCIVADNYELLKVTTTGTAKAYTLPVQPPAGNANDVLRGPDGNIWIPTYNDDSISVFNVKNATFSLIASASPVTCYNGTIVTGPDGNIWEAGIATGVSVFLRKTLTVTPMQLTFTATGQSATLQASETGNPTLTAKSTNTAVATETAGTTFNSFVVQSVGAGSAKIIVTDGKGNSFNVPVSVQ